MSLDNPQDRKIIEAILPNLKSSWRISSPREPKYNCIAWAGLKDNIWWWPSAGFDGVEWPFGLPYNLQLNTFIKLFENLNYERCDNSNFEVGHQKVAIYINDHTKECTHAARQNLKGVWTSKLGEHWDIEHPDPFAVEGPDYGVVAVIMKRKHT